MLPTWISSGSSRTNQAERRSVLPGRGDRNQNDARRADSPFCRIRRFHDCLPTCAVHGAIRWIRSGGGIGAMPTLLVCSRIRGACAVLATSRGISLAHDPRACVVLSPHLRARLRWRSNCNGERDPGRGESSHPATALASCETSVDAERFPTDGFRRTTNGACPHGFGRRETETCAASEWRAGSEVEAD